MSNLNSKNIRISKNSAGSAKRTFPNKPGNNKWNQERRLEFIDYRLCWSGHINRSDLVEFFGISIPQSSLDLAKYSEMAPKNLEYDRHQKVYIKTAAYKPLYSICSASSYLNDLYMNAQGFIHDTSNYLLQVPTVACFAPPKRVISYEILSNIVFCILNRQKVRITYQSMTGFEPSTRVISPHALGFDGIRWHVRSYCHEKKDFRDFVLSRILSAGKAEPSEIDPNEDMQWNFVVSLHIVPDPELSDSQKRAIELEYGMENGEVVYKCRQALLLYTLLTLRLTPSDEEQKQKQKQDGGHSYRQIALKNKNEIYVLLKLCSPEAFPG